MHNMLRKKSFLSFCLVLLPALSFGQQRAAFGPVESLADGAKGIVVLGQPFTFTDATRIAINGSQVSLAAAMQLIEVEQYIVVEGLDSPTGTVAVSLEVSQGQRVAGATSVFVSGPIAEVDRLRGRVRIGGVWIDATSIAPELNQILTVGMEASASGIQPVRGGAIVGPVQLSVGGSGRRADSVGGSGSSLQSVGGSGSIIQSVGGSGVRKNSVGGSGIRLESVGGSGASIQSVGGSGSSIQSVGGSGSSIQSVGGSGTTVQSVGGSGTQIQSVGGSGVRPNSVGGSGTQKLSVGGSGSQKLSVGGSGSR